MFTRPFSSFGAQSDGGWATQPDCGGERHPHHQGSHEQIAAVGQQISRSPLVERYAFLSRTAAFSQFHPIFAHSHDVTTGVRVTDLPEAFRVKLVNHTDRRTLQRAFMHTHGVRVRG